MRPAPRRRRRGRVPRRRARARVRSERTPLTSKISVHFLHPRTRKKAEEYLREHPGGWCDLAAPPYSVQQRGRKGGREGVRVGVCGCLGRPIFVKAIPWRKDYDKKWKDTPQRYRAHKDLHAREDLLAPILHIRTETEWIRLYPYWPMDLSTFLKEPGGRRCPVDLAVEMLRRMARAMCALEEGKILHRDLKTSNVLVDFEGTAASRGLPTPPFLLRAGLQIVLADFADQGTIGTKWWAAPEQFAHKNPCDISPTFGFGMMIWACLARRPFRRHLKKYLERIGGETSLLVWPRSARAYLSGSPSPFEEEILSLDGDAFRDPKPSVLRAPLLSLAAAALRYDVEERRTALERALGPQGALLPVSPARAVSEWLEAGAASQALQE